MVKAHNGSSEYPQIPDDMPETVKEVKQKILLPMLNMAAWLAASADL
ncbi:hypothetical protein OUHCRE11_00290 [Enterobacter asburiae]